MNPFHLFQCVESFETPSIDELLRQVTIANVCTNTMCFDSEQAAFGIEVTGQERSHNAVLPAICVAFLVAAFMSKLKTMGFSDKNGQASLSSLRLCD